jgi:hypothetical protein
MLLILASGFGNGGDIKFNLTTPMTIKPGRNDLALLSMTVGLQVNYFTKLYLNLWVSIEASGAKRSPSFQGKSNIKKE